MADGRVRDRRTDRLTRLVCYLRGETAHRIPIRRSTIILAVALAGALTLHVEYPRVDARPANTARPATATTVPTRSLPVPTVHGSARP